VRGWRRSRSAGAEVRTTAGAPRCIMPLPAGSAAVPARSSRVQWFLSVQPRQAASSVRMAPGSRSRMASGSRSRLRISLTRLRTFATASEDRDAGPGSFASSSVSIISASMSPSSRAAPRRQHQPFIEVMTPKGSKGSGVDMAASRGLRVPPSRATLRSGGGVGTAARPRVRWRVSRRDGHDVEHRRDDQDADRQLDLRVVRGREVAPRTGGGSSVERSVQRIGGDRAWPDPGELTRSVEVGGPGSVHDLEQGRPVRGRTLARLWPRGRCRARPGAAQRCPAWRGRRAACRLWPATRAASAAHAPRTRP
jgi:hypothetical protein